VTISVEHDDVELYELDAAAKRRPRLLGLASCLAH
jgi:hypothetical protein